MRKIDKQIEQRPHYYYGQLLQEDDFLREQQFHLNARRRHNLNLHGSGVVKGLKLVRNQDGTVTLNPGCAIDSDGREMVVDSPVRIDLGQQEPRANLRIGLFHEESDTAPQKNAIECYTWVTIAAASESRKGLTLALIQLDEDGAFEDADISYAETNYVDILEPGSVNARALHPTLKRGWLRLPFRPVALVNAPKGEKEIPLAFRVGATEAITQDPREAGEKDRGGAGTMAIPIPPNASRITRVRIAGAANEGVIQLVLIIGGWDFKKKKHLRTEVLDTTIASESPFQKTFELANARLDPQFNTASLWLWGTRRTSISLVAIEFAYFDE